MNIRSVIALILTLTVCISILSVIVGALLYPPGTIAVETRTKMFELITYIVGVISGYLLGKDNSKDKEP